MAVPGCRPVSRAWRSELELCHPDAAPCRASRRGGVEGQLAHAARPGAVTAAWPLLAAGGRPYLALGSLLACSAASTHAHDVGQHAPCSLHLACHASCKLNPIAVAHGTLGQVQSGKLGV